MTDIFSSPTIQAVLAIGVLCVLLIAAFCIVSIFRDYAADDHSGTPDVLVNLQEMHRKGDITDEEFRTIKARNQPTTHDGVDGDSSETDESPPST